MQQSKGRKLFKMTQFKLVHLTLIIALILITGVSLLWFLHSYIPNPYPNVETYSLVLIYMILIFVTFIAYNNSTFLSVHQHIGFNTFKVKFVYFAFFTGASIWVLDYIYQTRLLGNDSSFEAHDWGNKNKDLIIAFVTTVIFAPIIEEMLLRGVFLQTIRKYTNMFWSAIIVSALFTMLHFSWTNAPSLFIASLFYAWITFKSQSIIPAIIAHVLNNCFTYVYYLLLIKVI